MLVTKFNSNSYPSSFRFFEDALNDLIQAPVSSRPWTPSVDIFETQDELVVKADLPEVKQEDIAINLENGVLSLKVSVSSSARKTRRATTAWNAATAPSPATSRYPKR
jgi:HSP20 family molecular chaperone IbpA